MKVLIKEPGKPAEERDIENTLEALQEIVGGNIEAVYYSPAVVIWVNEEGKYLGLAPNFINEDCDDIICGTVVATRVNDSGDCADLRRSDIAELTECLEYFAVEKWRSREAVE